MLQRPKLGGPGLIVSDGEHGLTRQPQTETKLASEASGTAQCLRLCKGEGAKELKFCAVRTQECSRLSVAQEGSLWEVTDITDYTLLGEHGLLSSTQAPFLLPGGAMTVSPPANTTCTGIIIHPAFERQKEEASHQHSH